jgi:arylsulfatase A-like enzyme
LHTRRHFIQSAAGVSTVACSARAAGDRPNILLVITDDQGYGDLSLHGNPHLKTPNLDRIAKEGVQFTQFHVSPVCAPTRSSLMTGRYNYRTGVVDTYLGRAMMYPDEVTLPEILGKNGYRTGIFGKWHLGDNYPLRAIDQGFQEALVHTGGGITQPSDPPGNTYFDPVLFRNGKAVKSRGYCTDVFTDAAIRFIESPDKRPFFAYLATNAPHTPLQISDPWAAPFRKKGLNEDTSAVYGMIRNIDQNVGRVLQALEERKLEQNTIVIFMTDNGPQQERYNAGMRGRKGTVYQGGIRVPFFVRWPVRIRAGLKIDRIAAHIDILPTLLDFAGVERSEKPKVDGLSLMPLLGNVSGWPDRNLFFQWHRGDAPEPHRSAAVRNQRYKLVNGKELYDVEADPAEGTDISARFPRIVEEMRAAYDDWFRDVSSTRGYDPPRIVVGSAEENPTILTRQDWRGPRAGWDKDSLGYWEIAAAHGGSYDINITFAPVSAERILHFSCGLAKLTQQIQPNSKQHTFTKVDLRPGALRLEAWLEEGAKTTGVEYVRVKK